MRLSFFMFAFLLLVAEMSFAISVKGSAKGFEGQYIRLYSVADFISYREVKLDVSRINADGSFQLNGHLLHAGLIKIRIEDKNLDLLAFPDFDLQLELTYDEEANAGRLYDKMMHVKVQAGSDEGLNAYLFEYQSIYAEFLEENEEALLTKKMLPEVEKFRQDMFRKYAQSPPYFQTYLQYDLAMLEDAVLGSEKKLYDLHIKDKAILYDNMAYMKFIEQFYRERFLMISQGKKGFELLSAVNGTQDYASMMALIQAHEFAMNDTLAQLFAILGLKEVYGDETFKKKKVISMLEMVRKKSINKEHERIVDNIMHELAYLKPGQKAPDFSLRDASGAVHHLMDHDAKNVLLMFWSAYSLSSMRDMEFMVDYAGKYADQLVILAINMDADPTKAMRTAGEKNWPFLVLYRDAQYDLIDKYRVYSTPKYALIGADGRIVQYPADSPESNLEGNIYRLILKDSGKELDH